MSYSDFQIPIRPKVTGTRNLHDLLPSSLDFFICLSSMSGVIGVSGQSNYAAGNTYQDALMHSRIASGQKGVFLNLGVLLSIGYVAEHSVENFLKNRGYMGVSEEQYLALLDYYCDPRLPVLSPLQCQVVTGIQTPAALHAKGVPEVFYLQAPLFRHLRQIKSNDSKTTESAKSNSKSSNEFDFANLQQRLNTSNSLVEAEAVVLDGLIAKVSKSLDVDRAQIEVQKPLHAHGIDSLAAVEVRSWLRCDLGAELPVFEILGNQSISELAAVVARGSRFVAASLRENQVGKV